MSIMNDALRRYRFRKRHAALGIVGLGLAYAAWSAVDFSRYVTRPVAGIDLRSAPSDSARFGYDLPLDPASPWPKFRANAGQTGRSAVRPQPTERKPWVFSTGKGIFSSPVIDGEDTMYMGSADHYFYALHGDGSLKWKLLTGGLIDSSALLDDEGRVYFGSGDSYLYGVDRETGRVIWKLRAHTPAEVESMHDMKVYNVDWFEGNVAMTPDGDLLAGNDNYLYYVVDRRTGREKRHLVSNEMAWPLPAVNARTHRIFAASTFVALRNLFAFDADSGERLWAAGGLGSMSASPLLTSSDPDGVVVAAGFDGYVRAFGQANGRQLWKHAARDHIYASPAQLRDGTIIAASADGSVYALDPDNGELRWAFDTLEPIRSSPAVDGSGTIYVGGGDGKLYAINDDGTLRWAYRCIEDERNDLNGSPGLGRHGVFIGGENGAICFVPYGYCLGPAGRDDGRCARGPGEALPSDGARLYYTSRFGSLLEQPPARIDANESLTFTLNVRRRGDTELALIDKDSLRVEVSSDAPVTTSVAANRTFLTMIPEAAWSPPAGGTLRVHITGDYLVDPWRLGLKPFWGRKGGRFDQTFELEVRARPPLEMPYAVPSAPGDPATAFVIGRLAAPNPTMLPSWNQLGFDSIRYLAGLVEGSGDHAVVWVTGGRYDATSGRAVIDPGSKTRFALELDWDDGLLTLHNEQGFTLAFNGAWGMPYVRYRLATRADATGTILEHPALNAVASCDDIENYGFFLKLMGMSEADTGLMHAYGGADMAVWGDGPRHLPDGVGSARFDVGATGAEAVITGGTLRASEHAAGLLLVDAGSGKPISLSYEGVTSVEADASGAVRRVSVTYERGTIRGPVRAYYMVDTYPAAVATVQPPPAG